MCVRVCREVPQHALPECRGAAEVTNQVRAAPWRGSRPSPLQGSLPCGLGSARAAGSQHNPRRLLTPLETRPRTEGLRRGAATLHSSALDITGS